jgi:predicted dinucleotide-utilizing enzyme
MREISIVLTEPEAAALEELARRADISVEEAAAKAVRFVLKEAMDWARSCARKNANGGEERWCVVTPFPKSA